MVLNIWRHLKAAIAFDFASTVRESQNWHHRSCYSACRSSIVNMPILHRNRCFPASWMQSPWSLWLCSELLHTPTLLHPELLMPRQTHRADGINLLREYSVANGPLARCWCQLFSNSCEILQASNPKSPATSTVASCWILDIPGWMLEHALQADSALQRCLCPRGAHAGPQCGNWAANVEWTWAACHLGYPLFILYIITHTHIYIYIIIYK